LKGSGDIIVYSRAYCDNKYPGLSFDYRVGHSTETALLKVMNEIVRSTCDQNTTTLLTLDIGLGYTAFDSIDLHIFLEGCRKDFGVNGLALNWLTSFITCRTQHIGVGDARLASVSCLSGVPQGSVLGPLLFAK